MKKQPLIIIAGPTASGKSATAVALAHKIGGEIISADSMQVYRGMDVGTAKVTPEETEGIPHHLIDIRDFTEGYDVTQFQAEAKKAMEEIYSRGHVPIICGGTGFYIQSVLYDIDFTEDVDMQIRESLEREAAEKGGEVLFERLMSLDPKTAEMIHPNNTKRVIRALEFFLSTGKPLADHNEEQRNRTSPYAFRYYVLNMDRGRLYDRIDRRVEQMMENGLADEVESFREKGATKEMVSMQGIGYRQVLGALSGEYSMEEAVTMIQSETRHFARRQLIWFRREKEVTWVDMEKYRTAEDAASFMETDAAAIFE